MSELEKAKQEVEQVCFAYDKAGDTGDIKDWKEYYDLENKLIEKVKIANQPSLTIPKSIAEQADKYLRMDWEFWDIDLDTGKCTDEFYEFINCEDNDQENSKLIIAYLAGKALGVDLVKVGEG